MKHDAFSIDAQSRTHAGKGASRRLRRLDNRVPGIVYGANKPPQLISLAVNEMAKAVEKESFFSHIIKLNLDGQSIDVLVKDMQRHPVKQCATHIDFLRVDKDHKVTVRVPLHFLHTAECKAVKLQGAQITHNMSELVISCFPQFLPEYIEIDLIDIEAGDILHISDVKLPEGVQSVALLHGASHNLPVVTAYKPRAAAEEAPAAGAAAAAAPAGKAAAKPAAAKPKK